MSVSANLCGANSSTRASWSRGGTLTPEGLPCIVNYYYYSLIVPILSEDVGFDEPYLLPRVYEERSLRLDGCLNYDSKVIADADYGNA